MAYEKFTGEEYIDTDLVAKLNQDFDACGKLASKNTWSADNDFTAGLTVHKTPTVNADVSNKKYVDDSVASATADLLSSNNTWTGSNIYRKNITVSNGSAAGSQGQVIFGVKPSTATVQASIIASTKGELKYIATESTGHYFKIGNNIATTSITTDEGEAAIFSHNAFEFARVTNVGVARWLGNANTATKLETARTINGVSFDGTANITIADSTKLPIAGGTMTGDLTLKGNPTADLMAATKKYVDDSVASATADLLSSNNTWTGSNIYRKNITVSNGSAAGSQGQVIFGVKPSTATVQASIIASTKGELKYIATESTGHYFKIGNNTASTSITTDEGEAAIFSHNAFEFARITNVGVAKWLGNANTATKLETARTITANLASSTAGSFDGSANITVGVTGTLPIANGGTGATTAAAARTALGCAPAYTYSTTDLTAGSSALTTGTLYIVYE